MYQYADSETKQSVGLSEKTINMIIETEHASRPIIDLGCIQISPLMVDYHSCEKYLKTPYKAMLTKVLTDLGGSVENGVNMVAAVFKVDRNNKEEVATCVRFFMSNYISYRIAVLDHKIEKLPDIMDILKDATE